MRLSIARSRLAPSAAALGLLALAGILFAGPLALPIPRLVPGDPQLRLMLPALLASAVSSTFAQPLLPAEELSPREVRRIVACVAAGTLGGITLILGVASLLSRDAGFLASARNTLIYAGAGFVAVALVGGIGTAIPVVAAMLLAVVASEEGSRLLAWAVSPSWDAVTFLVALGIAGAGLAVVARGP